MPGETERGGGGGLRSAPGPVTELLCVALGVLVIWLGWGYRAPTVGLVGPALVPLLTGAGLVLLPLYRAVRLAFGASRFAEAALTRGEGAAMGVVAAIAVVFFLGLPYFGFLPTAAVCLLAAMGYLRGRPILVVALAVVLPVLFWLVFVQALGLTLPVGDLFYGLLYGSA